MALKKISAGLMAFVLTSTAVALAATPADLITARQQNYKQIGKSSKAILDEMKNSPPSMTVIQQNANILDGLAPKLPTWFPKGTGAEAGVKTAALPAIWTDNAGFRKAAAGFATATAAMKVAAASGDPAKVKAAIPALAGACRTCHETYKAR